MLAGSTTATTARRPSRRSTPVTTSLAVSPCTSTPKCLLLASCRDVHALFVSDLSESGRRRWTEAIHLNMRKIWRRSTFRKPQVSKLRAALRKVGVPAPHGIATEAGTDQFVMPSPWIDIEHGRTAIDRAEGALRRNCVVEAWSNATLLPPSRGHHSCRTNNARGFSINVR